MLAIFLGSLDQTIVSVALPKIADEFHGFALLAWVVSGYLVAATVATPVYGKLGDLFGRRALLTSAIAIFLVASTACALAQSMTMLVLARVVQGLGGGGLISTSQAIIADVVALRERGRYQGYISGVFAVSSVAGPVVGGFLTHYVSWRWCFWINLPLGLAALLVSRRALSLLRVPRIKRSVDYVGALVLTGGLTSLLLGITRIGQGALWIESTTVGLLAAALLLLAIFAWWERRASEPIVPLSLFRLRAVSLSWMILFFAFFNLIGLTVLTPLRLQVVAGATANVAALRLLPLSLMIPVGTFVAGRLMLVTGRYRPIQIAGTTLVPVAILALAFIDQSAVVPVALAMAVAGIGLGLQFPTSLVAVQNSVEPSEIGIATAVTAFFRSLGGALGIAVLTTVLLASLEAVSDVQGNAMHGARILEHLMAQTLTHASGEPGQVLRMHAHMAFSRILLLGSFIAAIPIGLAWSIPEHALRARLR